MAKKDSLPTSEPVFVPHSMYVVFGEVIPEKGQKQYCLLWPMQKSVAVWFPIKNTIKLLNCSRNISNPLLRNM